MEKSKKKKYLIAGIVFTICIMVGTSYAWWTSTAKQEGINEIQSTCIEMKLENEQNDISLTNAYPLTDEEAEKLTPYTFTIRNTCNSLVDYTVKLEKLSNSENQNKLLDSKYVAVEFNGGQKQILSEYPNGTSTYDGKDYTTQETKNLIKGTLTGSETKTYTIKLWMDEHVTIKDDAMNKSFVSKIVVDGSINEVAQYDEPILHGADPVLESTKPVVMQTANEIAEETPTTTDKLIPVIINEEDGTVTRANLAHDWYNYEEKRWANAVILIDNAKEYKEGETIPEDQIESYFVWIPKFKYKLFDLGNYTSLESENLNLPNKAQRIEIDFDLNNTTITKTSCETPIESGASEECEVGKWMTHPAFLAFNTNGIWVGKFETGYNQNKNNFLTDMTNWNYSEAEKDENAPTKVIIKPNVYSWRKITVGNAYYTSYSYQRDLESHMMKNTEWGAVAYLSHSIYGTCDKNSCTEVRINNSANFVTGMAAKIAPTTNYDGSSTSTNQYGNSNPEQDNDISYNYKNKASNIASTTGNYSGIYDMSGGAWELMSSTMYKSGNIEIEYGTSGLNNQTLNDKSYYDLYKYNDDTTHWERRILGDATGELGPFIKSSIENISSWYKDFAGFPSLTHPWFIRGCSNYCGVWAGITAFFRNPGATNSDATFRIVLTP